MTVSFHPMGILLRSAPRLAMPASDARSAQRIFRDVQAAAKYGLEFFRSLQAANSVRPPWIRPRRGSEGSRAVVLSLWFAVMADLLRVLDRGLCCHWYIAPIISYPHAHLQVHPLVDSPAGRKAVDILLCIVDRQRKSADFDVVIRVKFAICIVSGSQIPTELIL